jgi:hypothetical protein
MRYIHFVLYFFLVNVVYSQALDVQNFLIELGFENVSVVRHEDDLFITYENNLYRFEAKSLAVVVSEIGNYDISDYKAIHFLLRNQDLPIVLVSGPSNSFISYSNGLIDSYELIDHLYFTLDVDRTDNLFSVNREVGNRSFFKIDIPVGLELDYALGDFNNGLMTRTYINPRVLTSLAKGLTLEFKYQNIVQNDLPGSAYSSPLIFKIDQSFRFKDNMFLSLSAGYLPHNKFGFQTRFRNYLDNEQFYVEFGFGLTRLGYLDKYWSVESNRNTDANYDISFNYRWNNFDTDISLKYGTFLAGDLGYKLILQRQYHEVFFSLFYARTDVLSAGSFGTYEDGIFGFSITVPFGQSKYSKPNRFRLRTEDKFDLLYRYSGFSLSGVSISQGESILTGLEDFYPFILRKGLVKYLGKD